MWRLLGLRLPAQAAFVVAMLGIGSALAVSAQEQSPGDRFYQAIRNDNLAALRTLVAEFGANPKDPQGHTPLMLASAFGSSEALRLLIAGGAAVNTLNGAGISALHWSVGDAGKVRLLLAAGADVNVRSQLGKTPLLVAAATNGASETVGLLLAKGAEANTADTTGVTPLIAAATVGDRSSSKLLLASGADVNAKASLGQASTPLMGAAFNGDAELARLLIGRTADLNAVSADRTGTVKNGPVRFGNVTALHMATMVGSADVVKLLLDAGAAVDTPDVRGMTALTWSVSTDHPSARIVRLLLDKGADPSLRSNLGESPLDWARKFNDASVIAEMKLQRSNVPDAPLPAASGGSQPPTPREAVERSMPLLRSSSSRVLSDGGCVACHAQPITAMAEDLAVRGWRIERDSTASSQATVTLTAAVQGLLQGVESGGAPDTQLYVGLMMAAQNTPPSLTTDTLVHYLAAKQRQAGNWHGLGGRAPIQDGDISRTAMAIRALAAFEIPARKAELAKRIQRAATWLATQTPQSTEDRAMQLLGLKWANANARVRENLKRELASAQRSDGGWAQTAHLGSDAYATGQALFALRETGVSAAEPVLQRGIAFLLRTQGGDGSWYVKSRAMKIQPYFESGFPHGHDQWISQAATAWATMALSLIAADGSAVATAR